MKRVFRKDGIIIFVTASMEATKGTWVSLSYSFPENDRPLHSGDTVKLLIRGINVILYDYYWTDDDYRLAAERAGLMLVKLHKPLGSSDDSIEWRDEQMPPLLYVLRNNLDVVVMPSPPVTSRGRPHRVVEPTRRRRSARSRGARRRPTTR